MREENLNSQREKDTFTKNLSLGKGEIIHDSRDTFRYLCDINKFKVYDNNYFIKENLFDKIKLKKYTLLKDKPLSFYRGYEIFISNEEKYKKFSLNDWNVENKGFRTPDVIYDLLRSQYKVDRFKTMKGLFDIDTNVYFYIEDTNTVIAHSGLSCDDMLNLLSIKNLNIYVYTIRLTYHRNSELSETLYDLNLYNITIDKGTFSLIKQEAENREASMNNVKKRIKGISPSYSPETYFTLENKERAIKVYTSLSKELQRALQEFILDTRGSEAFKLVSQFEGILSVLSKNILPVDLLMQSYNNITKYNELNKDMLEKDLNYNYDRYVKNYYRYTNDFTEYKSYMKDFNSRYKTFSKWVKEWYSIVKQSGKNKTSYSPNKDSIYYKISEELSDRLSNLWFISEVILFGSVSKGIEKEGSDIDIVYKVGINTKDLPIARRETMHRVVKEEVYKLEQKYPELVKLHLDKTYEKGDIRRDFAIVKLFDVLAIQFQKKKQLKLYEEVGFLDNSVVLLKKDDFEVKYRDTIKKMSINNIDYVLFPTDRLYTFIINKKSESDSELCLEYIKFNYINDATGENKYQIEYIANYFINKKECFSRYSSFDELRFELLEGSTMKEFDSWDWEQEKYIIAEAIRKYGIRNVNPNVNYIEDLYENWVKLMTNAT